MRPPSNDLRERAVRIAMQHKGHSKTARPENPPIRDGHLSLRRRLVRSARGLATFCVRLLREGRIGRPESDQGRAGHRGDERPSGQGWTLRHGAREGRITQKCETLR